MANEKDFLTIDPSGTTSDLIYELEGVSVFLGQYAVGWLHEKYDFSSGSWITYDKKYKGAMRFVNVTIPQGASVNFADLAMYVGGREGTQPVKFKIWGIKQTDIVPFSTGGSDYPFSKTKTTAFVTGQFDSGFFGQYKKIGVKSIIDEIVAQGGWASGHALAFIIEDDGTTTGSGNQYINSVDTVLSVRIAAEPNLTPTPKSVAAPTFPDPYNLGMRYVAQGYNALESPDTPEITQYSTKRTPDFIKLEGNVTTTANVESLVPHGLGFKPRVEGYVLKSGGSQRFRCPRVVPPIQGAADEINGSVEADGTYLRIKTNANADMYYKVYLNKIDPA